MNEKQSETELERWFEMQRDDLDTGRRLAKALGAYRQTRPHFKEAMYLQLQASLKRRQRPEDEVRPATLLRQILKRLNVIVEGGARMSTSTRRWWKVHPVWQGAMAVLLAVVVLLGTVGAVARANPEVASDIVVFMERVLDGRTVTVVTGPLSDSERDTAIRIATSDPRTQEALGGAQYTVSEVTLLPPTFSVSPEGWITTSEYRVVGVWLQAGDSTWIVRLDLHTGKVITVYQEEGD